MTPRVAANSYSVCSFKGRDRYKKRERITIGSTKSDKEYFHLSSK
jgi:hypothetical protein